LKGIKASFTVHPRYCVTGVVYSKAENYKLTGYSDSDWCRDIDDRKSTSGYVFFMSNIAFSWLSKKQ